MNFWNFQFLLFLGEVVKFLSCTGKTKWKKKKIIIKDCPRPWADPPRPIFPRGQASPAPGRWHPPSSRLPCADAPVPPSLSRRR